MRLNLSNSSKPIKRRRSVAHVVSSTNSYLVMGGHIKFPIWKRTPYDTRSIDSKFIDVADFECWNQKESSFGVGLLKRSLANIGDASAGQTVDGAAVAEIVPGRQHLTIRKRRRSIRQHRQQQQARRFLTQRKQSQCFMDMVDPDQISQWSVPVAVTGACIEDDRLETLFTSNSLSLVRSHSQQNFCDCDETEIYCYETAPIALTTADNADHEYQGNVSNVEPNLNYYVENFGDVQIRDNFTNEASKGDDAQQDDHKNAHSDAMTQSYIKDEDNLFDNLCHLGCLCSDNPESAKDQQDLLRCAEIQKSEIAAKAFLVYINYYSTNCHVKILNGDAISAQARDSWQNLSQKEKLPFLLQAYISDYMPQN